MIRVHKILCQKRQLEDRFDLSEYKPRVVLQNYNWYYVYFIQRFGLKTRLSGWTNRLIYQRLVPWQRHEVRPLPRIVPRSSYFPWQKRNFLPWPSVYHLKWRRVPCLENSKRGRAASRRFSFYDANSNASFSVETSFNRKESDSCRNNEYGEHDQMSCPSFSVTSKTRTNSWPNNSLSLPLFPRYNIYNYLPRRMIIE